MEKVDEAWAHASLLKESHQSHPQSPSPKHQHPHQGLFQHKISNYKIIFRIFPDQGRGSSPCLLGTSDGHLTLVLSRFRHLQTAFLNQKSTGECSKTHFYFSTTLLFNLPPDQCVTEESQNAFWLNTVKSENQANLVQNKQANRKHKLQPCGSSFSDDSPHVPPGEVQHNVLLPHLQHRRYSHSEKDSSSK